MRVVAFTAHHDILSGGKVEYKASYGPNIDCKGAKTWTTFQKLERAAGARKKPKQ